MSRDTDRFGRKDSAMSSNPGTPNSLGRSTPSRESIFEVGSSNTLPRDKSNRDTSELDLKMIAESQGESQNQDKTFTPCLARRLSRQFIEQTRLSLPRSPSIPRERLYRSSTEEPMSRTDPLTSPILPESYRSRSSDRSLRRATSLLEPQEKPEKIDHRAARRSVSLFEDDDELLPPLPRQIMTLGRKYRDPVKSASNGIRRESFRAEKIQEEPVDVNSPKRGNNLEVNIDTLSTSENTSACNSNTNLGDMSSFSTKSCETSPADSTSNMQGEAFNSFKADAREFENRLLAAENLIKESKLRNLGINRFDPNLSSSYKDTDKCDKELLGSMSDLTSAVMSKRRSCIPSLRLRSGSLTREASGGERRRTLEDGRAATPERSLLSKFFRSSSSTRDSESKEKSPKARRRISRFLRPDFFDTPREESQYVKEKEAQKAAENERRKSRFMRKKVEPQENSEENGKDEKQEKELKNEANTLTKEKIEEKQSFDGKDNKIENDGSLGSNSEGKLVRQSSKNSFLQSLEKKLEKLRSNDEAKVIINGDSGKQNSVVAPEDLQERQDSAENLRKVLSEENLSVSEVQSAPAAPTPKSKVSSVLGLFKNDSKSSLNGNKQPNTLLSKFKKNSYKGSRSDTSVIIGEASGSSKIPTKSKLESKVDSKVPKKVSETKKSLDKGAEAKKSPSKEKSKEKSPPKEKSKEKTPPERSSVEKKSSSEKSVMKSLKKLSPEKSTDGKSDKLIKELRKSGTPEKSDKCSFVSRLSPKKISPDKTLDTNKKAEVKLPESEEKKVVKKKTVKSLTSPLTKNGSISKLAKTDDDRKIRRIIVKQEIVEREGPDGTKKKKIVRVVKKVVKKSESAENKTEEKDKDKEKTKPTRSLSLKKITLKKEKSPESASKNEESSPEAPKLTKKSESNSAEIVENCKGKPDKNSEILEGAAASENPIILPRKSPEKQKTLVCADASSLPPPEDPKSRDSDEKFRANRCNLKLDLSKIPQHTFKPPPVPKRESPKPEATKLQSPGLDSISRMTHHANITGNRIVIDKALKSSDLVELKEEAELKQVAKFSVNSTQVPQPKEKEHQPESKPPAISAVPVKPKIAPDPPEEILSPMEDLESFDSWSMCSNDFNHRCSSELQSPTSPAYSPSSRSDHPESIIDRIRRKSFYSRFNERKRKSSLNVSSSGISSISPLPISSTLPRKFSFNSTKDIDRRKPTYSTSPTRRLSERPFSMYHDDHLSFRKSPIERDRYSDVGYTGDYDLRKYRISPTPEAHRKYQSSDFNYDHDLGTYKSPLSSSSLSEPVADYRGHAMTLPRKYGSLSSSEPKTAEYYEELLAPARLDYLTRRTPVPGDYVGKHENGYSNGHVDIAGAGDKWRSISERIPGVDSTDESDKSIGDDIRGNSRARTEAKELSAACPDAEAANAMNE